MSKIIETLKEKNIAVGWLYAYIHFITEVACFFFISKVTNGSLVVWMIPFIYDAFAFVPQGLIGRFCDKYPKFNIALLGTAMLGLALIMQFGIQLNLILNLIILCVGNCIMHVAGAECTLRNSEGKLSHSAIFVAGGSFGVITGRLLAGSIMPFWGIVLLVLTMIPFILLANTYYSEESFSKNACEKFNYANKNIAPFIIILVATLVVIVRGYMGYGIPTAWNKTTLQAVLLFVIMGIGKALGGILSDSFGIRKIAIVSTVLAIPFLCFGDNIMVISLIGVMFFSMTMAITLGILVSALPKTPGLAFGFTTIGLFLGTVPIFFVKMINAKLNILMIIALSFLCTFMLLKILNKDENRKE
ncbi:MAG: hypothetical protein IJ220_08840 [Clostridia bacterium]|nr:hypothetical protein [Clostridia bacterium]